MRARRSCRHARDPGTHGAAARARSRCAWAVIPTTSPPTRSWCVRARACPGTRPSSQIARAHGVPVRSEMDLVFERCRARICGITGTNGKTTTTALVAAILERAGERVHLGGNIGMTMLDRLDRCGETDWVVLELSSFQIESVREPRCAIACVLNVTPDHLDRHGDFAAYAETKRRLVRFALDDAVLGFDDPVTREMATVAAVPRAPVRPRPRHHRRSDAQARRRRHRRGRDGHAGASRRRTSRSSASTTSGTFLPPWPWRGPRASAPSPIAGAVRDFQAVPHRLQTVRDEDGVLWINDSKATNVESAIAALRSFPGRTIVWIGGGKGAGTSIERLADEVAARARHAVLNGASAGELDEALARRGVRRPHGGRHPRRGGGDARQRCATGRRRAAGARLQELRPVPRLRGSRPRVRRRRLSSSDGARWATPDGGARRQAHRGSRRERRWRGELAGRRRLRVGRSRRRGRRGRRLADDHRRRPGRIRAGDGLQRLGGARLPLVQRSQLLLRASADRRGPGRRRARGRRALRLPPPVRASSSGDVRDAASCWWSC